MSFDIILVYLVINVILVTIYNINRIIYCYINKFNDYLELGFDYIFNDIPTNDNDYFIYYIAQFHFTIHISFTLT